jgi:peptidyl-prolyl cis-trans isomerase A (cyclophilin A)
MKHMATRWIVGAALSLAAMGAWAQSVRFETTEGDFVVKVDAKAAPLTVKNFLYYVRMGF